jgi:hypothetical protein
MRAGDRISGRISREELASVVVAALGLPAATGKTMELRRQESADAAGKVMSDGDRLRLFLGVVEDRVRTRAGLEPFPMPAPPPAPVTEERKKEILSGGWLAPHLHLHCVALHCFVGTYRTALHCGEVFGGCFNVAAAAASLAPATTHHGRVCAATTSLLLACWVEGPWLWAGGRCLHCVV